MVSSYICLLTVILTPSHAFVFHVGSSGTDIVESGSKMPSQPHRRIIGSRKKATRGNRRARNKERNDMPVMVPVQVPPQTVTQTQSYELMGIVTIAVVSSAAMKAPFCPANLLMAD